MTLNPAKLGEVEVTLIQRGSNVHININSNNTALTLLAQNVNELKTQLANNGVVNTSMQFSTSHGEHQQQEGRHQQFQAYKELDQMSEEELDMITSMEIILPRYV
jgi:flagellar hook-length control protein FliK